MSRLNILGTSHLLGTTDVPYKSQTLLTEGVQELRKCKRYIDCLRLLHTQLLSHRADYNANTKRNSRAELRADPGSHSMADNDSYVNNRKNRKTRKSGLGFFSP